MVPVTGLPVVVLVLKLYPADAVHLLVDELLVAGCAVFRCFVHALAQLQVLGWIGTNQKIPGHSRGARPAPLPQVLPRLDDGEVRVALYIGFLDRVASQARNAFVIAVKPGKFLHEDVLGPGEERNGIMASPAVARGLRTVLFPHHALNPLEDGVHGGVSMGAGLPLLDYLRVTSDGTAAHRARERPCVERSAG